MAKTVLKTVAAAVLFLSPITGAADATSILPYQLEPSFFRLAEVDCSSSDPEVCYQEVRCKLIAKDFQYDGKPCSAYKNTVVVSNRYTQYTLPEKRPKNVAIAIHGLWGDAGQFGYVFNTGYTNNAAADESTARIALTLPGHLRSRDETQDYKDAVKRNPPTATFLDWVDALDQSVLLSRKLGDDLTVMGQSTGGLLSVLAAVRYPQDVKRIFLIEPALRVNDLMHFGACNFNSTLANLAKTLGVFIPNGASVKMGCEVDKLARSILAYNETKYAQDEATNKERLEQERVEKTRALARSIKQPVFVINNENDHIVSAKMNREFFEAHEGLKLYASINVDKKLKHGNVMNYADGILSLELMRFLVKTGRTEYAPNYRYLLASGLSEQLRIIGYRETTLKDAQNKQRKKISDQPQLIANLCEFHADVPCEKFREALAEFTTARNRVIEKHKEIDRTTPNLFENEREKLLMDWATQEFSTLLEKYDWLRPYVDVIAAQAN